MGAKGQAEYKSYLAYTQLKEYLETLHENGLIDYEVGRDVTQYQKKTCDYCSCKINWKKSLLELKNRGNSILEDPLFLLVFIEATAATSNFLHILFSPMELLLVKFPLVELTKITNEGRDDCTVFRDWYMHSQNLLFQFFSISLCYSCDHYFYSVVSSL